MLLKCVQEGGQCWLCSSFGIPCTPQLQVPDCSLSPWGSGTTRDNLTHFVSSFGIVKVESCIRIFVKLELHLSSLHFSCGCCHDNAHNDSIWQLMSLESVGRVVVEPSKEGLCQTPDPLQSPVIWLWLLQYLAPNLWLYNLRAWGNKSTKNWYLLRKITVMDLGI